MLTPILQNKPIANGVYDLRVAFETRPSPGTFLHVACGEGRVLRRPISVCGWSDGVVRLVYAAKGDGTRWLSRQKPGDRLDVLGPLGRGFDCSLDVPTLLVGGGLGVPPMLHCEDSLTATHALLGFRDKDAVILESGFGSIEVFTDDGSAGTKGFPHQRLPELLSDGKWARVFACGPVKMLQAVSSVCAEYDMETGQVNFFD